MSTGATSDVGRDLLPLVNSEKYSDVSFILQCGSRIHGHKCILASRSTYFEKLFSLYNETKEIPLDDISHKQCIQLLEFVYSGRVPDLKKLRAKELVGFALVANKFELDGMMKILVEEMKNHLSIGTVAECLNASAIVDPSGELRNVCLDFVCQNYDEVLKEGILKKLDREVLLDLIHHKYVFDKKVQKLVAPMLQEKIPLFKIQNEKYQKERNVSLQKEKLNEDTTIMKENRLPQEENEMVSQSDEELKINLPKEDSDANLEQSDGGYYPKKSNVDLPAVDTGYYSKNPKEREEGILDIMQKMQKEKFLEVGNEEVEN